MLAQQDPPKTVNYSGDGLVGIDRLPYSGSREFKATIIQRLNTYQLKGAAPYLVVTHVSQHEFKDINNIRDKQFKGLRFMYVHSENILIIRLGLSAVHELTHRGFVLCLEVKFFAMDLHEELVPMGATGFSGPGSEKEPDSAFKPSSRRFVDDWPTLVIECGVSQFLPRLQADAHWWLENSVGDVKTVVLVSYSLPEKKFHLETWELSDTPDPSNCSIFPPTITQEAEIIGDQVSISAKGVTQTSFVIDFTKVMLRQPIIRHGEHNFIFTKEDLVNFAGRVRSSSQ